MGSGLSLPGIPWRSLTAGVQRPAWLVKPNGRPPTPSVPHAAAVVDESALSRRGHVLQEFHVKRLGARW